MREKNLKRTFIYTMSLLGAGLSLTVNAADINTTQQQPSNLSTSTATYGFTTQLTPKPNSFPVPEDTQLKMVFDSPPTLGHGSIRIIRSRDNVEVDKISLTDEVDSLGIDPYRTIKTNPVRIDGKTVRISLHAHKLDLGESYYVVIPESSFLNANLAGQAFKGIGKESGWSFTTRLTEPEVNKEKYIVGKQGADVDFRTVQGALDFVMENVSVNDPVTVYIKNGIYEEPLYLRSKNNLTIQGESKDNTVIRYTNNEQMNIGPSGRSVFLIENSDFLTLKSLSLINTTLIGNGGQAEALYYNSNNGRLIARNANFISEQDTLNLKGWTWFYNTLVAGNVDYIWGYPKASVFENSEIRTIGDSRGYTGGGYILQARVRNENDPGFIFLNSKLTRGEGPLNHPVPDRKFYLARSGGCNGCYDNIVFVNTKMDEHIRDVGWANAVLPTPKVATPYQGWREFNTMDLDGNKIDLLERLPTHATQLTQEEVVNHYCSRQQIFSGYNDGMGWDPMPGNTANCENAFH